MRALQPIVVAIGAILGVAQGSHARQPQDSTRVDFGREIRPLLAENCFVCHGPDPESRQADLRLDDREEAIAAGVLAPGKPDESSLIERIFADDPDVRMPPPESHKGLDGRERELIRRWIAEGAEYTGHWAWSVPVRPELPVVRAAHAVHSVNWVRHPIDQFVLSALEKHHLQPADEAPLEALIRRAALDLTGLPPSPEELARTLADPSPDRYEKFVDRMLASPRWGEHRGRYWLDYARYADTHGIHFDNYREIWAYRDWVIKAFNRNLPFDQFTREQLAGDLLPKPDLDQLVATGFNRCNITTNEGGVIEEEYRVLYTRDRTETVSTVWLGLTAGCAVCHDHKYDPLSQREFYQLSAFFNHTTQPVMDGNVRDTPPVVPVPREEDRERWEAIASELAAAEAALSPLRESGTNRLADWLADASSTESFTAGPPEGPGNPALHLPLDDGGKSGLAVVENGSYRRAATPGENEWQAGWTGEQAWVVRKNNLPGLPAAGDFERDQPWTIAAWVKPANDNQFGAIVARMDDPGAYRGWDVWLNSNRVGTHIIHEWPGNAVKVISRDRLPAGVWSHVAVSYDGSSKAAGVQVYINGHAAPVETENDSLSGSIRTPVPLRLGSRNQYSDIDGAGLNDLRIFGRTLAADEVKSLAGWSRLASLTLRRDSLDQAARDELLSRWLEWHDPPYREATATLDALRAEKAALAARGTRAHITQEQPGEPSAHVLFRGEYTQRREQVGPATPGFLHAWPEGAPRNRLGLAEWILDEKNPLTARVTVNRFWQEVFGQGLVATTGDFGTAGGLPRNAALLDWLAVEFRESGWDVKKLFRDIVTSSTYRQAAVVTPEKLAADPGNELCSRGPRFRMDAEMVRDMALAASGLLGDRIGGPSARPYQPAGVWEAVAMPESDTRMYQPDVGEGLYRRSLYTFWKRAAPPAAMDVLNAPSREFCTVRRERTNTPLQALLTLNDPQFVEAARVLAARLLAPEKPAVTTDMERFNRLGQLVLSRSFTEAEQSLLAESLASLRGAYLADPDAANALLSVGHAPRGADGEAAAELAAWTMLVNQVLNLDEVLNK